MAAKSDKEKISSLAHTENTNAFCVQTTECSEQDDLFSPLSGLKKSLQTFKVSENEEKLMGLINVYTRQKAKLKVQILEALLFILRQLLAESSFCDTRGRGFLQFDDAYGLFISFLDKQVTKQEFRNYLLHKEYGLRVCVATIQCTR